jgi:MFS family permease
MNRNLFLLLQGQFVSQIGNEIALIATLFWVKQATDSATLMGIVMMVSALPPLLLGTVGGTFADRFSRKNIIVICDILSGVSFLLLAALLSTNSDDKNLVVIWLLVSSAFVASVNSFFKPAIASAIPDLVSKLQLTRANSLMQASLSVATFLGQGLGGLLFRVMGTPLLFLLDGITYLLSAFSESFIQFPPSKVKKHNEDKFLNLKTSLMEGIDYVKGNTGLKTFFLAVAALNIFSAPIYSLLPFYVEDTLQVKSDWYGFFLGATTIGFFTGYILAGTINLSGKARVILLEFLILLASANFIGLGLIKTPLLSLILMYGIGVSLGCTLILVVTLLQTATPLTMRGRVFGILEVIGNGLTPFSMGISGVVADLIDHNIPLIYITSGAIYCLIALSLFLNKELKEFLSIDIENIQEL